MKIFYRIFFYSLLCTNFIAFAQNDKADTTVPENTIRLTPLRSCLAQKNETSKFSSERRVSFNRTASIVLIPTKEEYHEAKLGTKLWRSKSYEREMQKDAIKQALMYSNCIPAWKKLTHHELWYATYCFALALAQQGKSLPNKPCSWDEARKIQYSAELHVDLRKVKAYAQQLNNTKKLYSNILQTYKARQATLENIKLCEPKLKKLIQSYDSLCSSPEIEGGSGHWYAF